MKQLNFKEVYGILDYSCCHTCPNKTTRQLEKKGTPYLN